MDCPHCHSTRTTKLQRTTELGYAAFSCKDCGRTFNERTGTPFNFVEVPTDIVFQVLLCRVRYKLSYREVAELFLLRGFQFTHETVREWRRIDRRTPSLRLPEALLCSTRHGSDQTRLTVQAKTREKRWAVSWQP